MDSAASAGSARNPDCVETVFVLSRVTLGADIKITSIMLSAMKRRFPQAQIVLVGNRKSADLFSADSRISHLNADYPRSGPGHRRARSLPTSFASQMDATATASSSIPIRA